MAGGKHYPIGTDILKTVKLRDFTPDLGIYTPGNLMLKTAVTWDSAGYIERMRANGRSVEVAVIDGGGSKVAAAIARVNPDFTVQHEMLGVLRDPGGKHYVEFLQNLKVRLQKERPDIKHIGISFGGPMDGNRFLGTDYLRLFGESMVEFEMDFGNLFAGYDVATLNDAAAMNVGVSVAVRSMADDSPNKFEIDFFQVKNLIGSIGGGGQGGGGMKDLLRIYEVEPGHVQAPQYLIDENDSCPICDMHNDNRICLQDAAGGFVSALERVMSNHYGRSINGEEAAQLLISGDSVAKKAYVRAAEAHALSLVGMTKCFAFNPEQTLYYLHGGGTKASGFSALVHRNVENNIGKVKFIHSADVASQSGGRNICIDGAAHLAANRAIIN